MFEMFSIFVPINQVFMDEKVILQVLAEQREEMSGYDVSGWISRPEEDFFEREGGKRGNSIEKRNGKTNFDNAPKHRFRIG